MKQPSGMLYNDGLNGILDADEQYDLEQLRLAIDNTLKVAPGQRIPAALIGTSVDRIRLEG